MKKITNRLKNYLKINNNLEFSIKRELWERKENFLKNNGYHYNLLYIFHQEKINYNYSIDRESLFAYAFDEVKQDKKLVLLKNMFFKKLDFSLPNSDKDRLYNFILNYFNFIEKEKIKELNIAEKFIDELIVLANKENFLLQLLYILDINLLKYLSLENKIDDIYNIIISKEYALKEDSCIRYAIAYSYASNNMLLKIKDRFILENTNLHQKEIIININNLEKNIGNERVNYLNSLINSLFNEKENLEFIKNRYNRDVIEKNKILLRYFFHLLNRDEKLDVCKSLDVREYDYRKETILEDILEHYFFSYLKEDTTIMFYRKML